MHSLPVLGMCTMLTTSSHNGIVTVPSTAFLFVSYGEPRLLDHRYFWFDNRTTMLTRHYWCNLVPSNLCMDYLH